MLFLRAMPAWRTKGLDRICEGFDRGEVLALMDLQGVADRRQAWDAIIDLEAELVHIRAEQPRAEQPKAEKPRGR